MIWTTDLVGSLIGTKMLAFYSGYNAHIVFRNLQGCSLSYRRLVSTPRNTTRTMVHDLAFVFQSVSKFIEKRCVLSPRETSPLPRPSFMTKEITLGYFQLIYQVIMNVCIFSILNPKRKAPLLSLILLDFHLYVNK